MATIIGRVDGGLILEVPFEEIGYILDNNEGYRFNSSMFPLRSKLDFSIIHEKVKILKNSKTNLEHISESLKRLAEGLKPIETILDETLNKEV
jgi:hypothetical protein